MQTYTITLEALTPVHIGSGEATLTKKDFELISGFLYVYKPIELHKMFGNKYESFLLDYHSNLTDFISKNTRGKNIELDPAVKYSLYCADESIRKSDNIDEFIKDPYGFAYIPGSSLKGAIRTALLAYEIDKNSNKYDRFRQQGISRHHSARELETAAFGEIVESMFKYFKVSDSKPIHTDALIAAKKIDVFNDGAANNQLNLCREALDLGIKTTFDVTVDTGKSKGMFAPDAIMEAIRFFSKQYRDLYVSKFSQNKLPPHGTDVLYLGGGTGMLTKTVNHSLYGDQAYKKIAPYLDDQFRKHNHSKDVRLGVSPRALKCTKVDGKLMEMGVCKIGIS